MAECLSLLQCTAFVVVRDFGFFKCIYKLSNYIVKTLPALLVPICLVVRLRVRHVRLVLIVSEVVKVMHTGLQLAIGRLCLRERSALQPIAKTQGPECLAFALGNLLLLSLPLLLLFTQSILDGKNMAPTSLRVTTSRAMASTPFSSLMLW